MAFAAAYDYNSNAVKTRSNMGDYMRTQTGFYETDIQTVFVDAMFKYKGFSFMGEFADRDADAPVAVDENGTETGDVVQVGNALNMQAGYLLKNNWEIAGRYTSVNFDKEVNKLIEEQYTLGISKYIAGHNLKVQSDLSYTTIGGKGNGLLFRIQMDIHL